MLHAAFASADHRTKRPFALKDLGASSVQSLLSRIAEQLLCSGVPEQNFAFERHNERCVRRPFEQPVHIPSQHEIRSSGGTKEPSVEFYRQGTELRSAWKSRDFT